MLARREPVTLRSLVREVGVSTIAVYTYFDNMTGLWRAVRHEGFARLASCLAAVPATQDPVRDLTALGAAYADNALTNPHLYRTMFDAEFDLDDPDVAAQSFDRVVAFAARARDRGRFGPETDPASLATRVWMVGHGVLTLILTGVLPPATLIEHIPAMTIALFVDAGDEPERCRRSVMRVWSTSSRQ